MVRKLLEGWALLLPLMTVVGCASVDRTATVGPATAPMDRSAYAARFEASVPQRVMVLPPSGTMRGEFEAQLNFIERAFLQRGIRIISPAVTGRVIAEEGTGKPREGAARLSDMERALILAKKSGAEAILQVGEWRTAAEGSRYFCGPKAGDLMDCDESSFLNARYGLELIGRKLRFLGRLLDVETGEVLISIDVEQLIVANFPWQTLWYRPGQTASYRLSCLDPSSTMQDFSGACAEAEEQTVRQIVEHIVAAVASTGTARPGLPPPGPEIELR